MPNRIMTTISKDGNATEHYEKSVVAEHISTRGEQVSVVMWLAPWPPVRETRVQIPEQHGNLVKFILVWAFFNPSGILTQP